MTVAPTPSQPKPLPPFAENWLSVTKPSHPRMRMPSPPFAMHWLWRMMKSQMRFR